MSEFSKGGVYWELHDFLASKKVPAQREIIAMLGEPQRRLMSCITQRASQLETFELELAELEDFAQLHSITNFGRFA